MDSIKLLNIKSFVKGIILLVPFLVFGMVAAREIEPFFTFLKITSPTSFWVNPSGYIILMICLFLLLLSGIILMRPVFQRRGNEKRKMYAMNILLASVVILYFMIFIGAWITEMIKEI